MNTTEVNGLVDKNVMPYMGVQLDKTTTFDTPEGTRTFRFITYQAYNAYGLIGSEYNGVAILDEDRKQVLCDEIAHQTTGWFGANPYQIKMADELIGMSWEDFKQFVNANERRRYNI